MIYILLFISVGINILIAWYAYKLIRKFLNYSQNVYFLLDDVSNFGEHLDAIYELQTFHGDETLRHLIQHSKKVKEDIEEFKINSVLGLEEEEIDEHEESEETETTGEG